MCIRDRPRLCEERRKGQANRCKIRSEPSPCLPRGKHLTAARGARTASSCVNNYCSFPTSDTCSVQLCSAPLQATIFRNDLHTPQFLSDRFIVRCVLHGVPRTQKSYTLPLAENPYLSKILSCVPGVCQNIAQHPWPTASNCAFIELRPPWFFQLHFLSLSSNLNGRVT